MSNFKDSELWLDAKALAVEAYRLTESWADKPEGKEFAAELRSSARTIAKMVPNAISKKSGPGGRPMWTYTMSAFSDVEVVCALAVELGYTDESKTERLLGMTQTVRSQFRGLAKEAREIAQSKRSKMFGTEMFDEDDEE